MKRLLQTLLVVSSHIFSKEVIIKYAPLNAKEIMLFDEEAAAYLKQKIDEMTSILY